MIEFICYNIISLGLFFLVYLFLLKKETNFKLNRIFLLITVGVCFATPFIQLDFGLSWDPIDQIKKDVDLENFTTNSSDWTPHVFEDSEIATSKAKNSLSLLISLYSIICIIMLSRLFWNLNKLFNSIKNGEKTYYNKQKIVLTKDPNSPYSFFNYIFLKQKHLENEYDIKSILLHEKCHSLQYHSFDILLIEILMCFAWFNPFIWLFKKEIETNHEFLADSYVINKGIHLTYYSTLIVNQSKSNSSRIHSGFSLIKTKNV